MAGEQVIRLRDFPLPEPSRITSWKALAVGRWRASYAVAGMLLGAAIVVGLLLLRAAFAPAPMPWLRSELDSHAIGYAFLAIVTILGLGLLGRAVGRRQDQLELSSSTDPLTELPNRRYFTSRLNQELLRAARYEVPVTLLVVDVDGLKQINDRHGHAAGDRALRAVADCLRSTCRATDVPVRCGGDEFAVLVPETSAEEALDLAKRIQLKVSRHGGRTRPSRLSVSIGVSDVARAGSTTLLSESADRALYAAKAAGRNAIVLAAPRRSIAS